MTRFARIALATVSALFVSACATTTPHFDKGFGNEVRTIWSLQQRNPTASVDNRDKLPDGIEGRAAKQALDRYHHSFTQPPRQVNVFTIGVGGSGGGEGGSGDAGGSR